MLQASLGCEVQEDGGPSAFWRFGYDGKDFLTFEPKMLSWTAADPGAWGLKEKWEADLKRGDRDRAFLEGTCTHMLRKYLASGGKTLERAVTILKCRALGFSPQNISLNWLRDGEKLPQRTLEPKAGLPSGDRTY
ncbi:hereditary hemochromatosis protein homolog [Tachyglossus aculeatus]|uniref:hereditary hemochromatosis protein homolog n=1 Tax=Tachyglossus aculeatus TaxID=9261 RepID=UPI0018F44474|nr:hereditary hemochromatosis protein homolog [Tachyglossus aculeatus]